MLIKEGQKSTTTLTCLGTFTSQSFYAVSKVCLMDPAKLLEDTCHRRIHNFLPSPSASDAMKSDTTNM